MSSALSIIRRAQWSPIFGLRNNFQVASLFKMTPLSYRSLSFAAKLSQGDKKASIATSDLFAAIKKENLNIHGFKDTLQSLVTRKVTLSVIPPDVMEFICHHVSQMNKENFHVAVKCLTYLASIGIRASDLKPKVVSTLDSNFQYHFDHHPSDLQNLLLALSTMEFNTSPLMLTSIDKALLQVSPNTNFVGIFRSLSSLKISWISLSLNTRATLENAVKCALPTYQLVQINHFCNSLRSMQATRITLPILSQPLIDRLNELVLSNSEADFSMIFPHCGSLKFDLKYFPPALAARLEAEFIKLYKQNSGRAVYYLNLSQTDYGNFSPTLQLFLQKELPIYLFEGDIGAFPDRFAKISLWMRWNMYSCEYQAKILSMIKKYSSDLSTKDSRSVLRSFISMCPKYDKLSLEIRSTVEKVFELNFSESSNNLHYQIDRMNQLGMRFPNLSHELQQSLLLAVNRGIADCSIDKFRLTLNGLSSLGVTSQDLRENLGNAMIEYILSHQEDINQLVPAHQVVLRSSIQSIFSTSV